MSRVVEPKGCCLTFEGDGGVGGASLLHLPQAQQCGGEERVVDEVLHVVALTLLLGLGAHLIRHVLPVSESVERDEAVYLVDPKC